MSCVEWYAVYRDHGVVPTSSRDDNNNKPSEDLTAYQLVEPNNLVMNKMKAWQGSIAISEHEGIVSPAYFVYQPNAEMFDVAVPKYIHYLLRHPIYIAQYLRQSKGIRVNQWDLDPDEFKKIELLLPRKEEQKKIIAFLDHEIAKIDALIEKQQRLKSQIQMVLMQILEPDARERLNTIKLTKPDFAKSVEQQLVMLAQSGRIKNKINDEQLKVILKQVIPAKREFNIRRKG